jgi:hypothetical protein
VIVHFNVTLLAVKNSFVLQAKVATSALGTGDPRLRNFLQGLCLPNVILVLCPHVKGELEAFCHFYI